VSDDHQYCDTMTNHSTADNYAYSYQNKTAYMYRKTVHRW